MPECLALLRGTGKKVELEEVDLDLELRLGAFGDQLLSSLQHNRSCTSLSFHRTVLSPSLLRSFADLLVNNTTLRVIFFKECGLHDDHIHTLSSALLRNKTVTELQLWDNNIGDPGAASLAAVLRANPALRRLNLNYNSLRDAGAGHLAAALQANSTLVSLDLFDNGIGDAGGRALAGALGLNRSLVELDLGGNLMGRETVEELFQALKVSKSLIYLNLERNQLQASAKRAGFEHEIRRVCSQRTKRLAAAVSNAIAANRSAPWMRSRLVFLGGRSAGKTATIRSLLELPFIEAPSPKHDDHLLQTQTILSSASSSRWIKANDWEPNAFTFDLAARIVLNDEEHSQRRASNVHHHPHGPHLPKRLSIPAMALSHALSVRPRRPSAIKQLLHKQRKGSVKELEEDGSVSAAEASMAKQVAKAHQDASDLLTVSVWDVGPQHELYHLYLTSCAVYAVVVDLRQSLPVIQGNLAPWAHTLAGQVSSRQILVVGTHAHEVTAAHVEAVGKALSWPLYAVDNRTGEGVEALRKAADAAMRSSDHVRGAVPLRWTRCLDALTETEENWMQMEEVRSIAERCGCEGSEEARQILLHFHQLGLVLYVDSSQKLQEVVTLNPQWLVRSIEGILKGFSGDRAMVERYGLEEDLDLFQAQGIASKDLLDFLLEDDQTDFLIDLMRSLLLLSEYHFGAEEQYLVPVLIDKRASMPIPKSKHRIEMDFSQHFLPPGFFERLICLCVQESSREPELRKGFGMIFVGAQAERCLLEKRKDLIVVGVDAAESCPYILAMISSFTRKIKQDFAGNRLTWTVRLSAKEKPAGFMDIQEAKRMNLAPWFNKDATFNGTGTFAEKSAEKLDSFMGL